MNKETFSFGQSAKHGNSMMLYCSISCDRPSRHTNPQEYYAKKRREIKLPEGWNWEEEVNFLKAEIIAFKADGTLVNKSAIPQLISLAEKSGEEAFVTFLKSQI